MSRGDRTVVTGNISRSMRENYGEHGVAQYYTKVGSTYRNPHYPGIRLCLFSWFNRWWQEEMINIVANSPEILLFDMACGRYRLMIYIFCQSSHCSRFSSGEVTLAFIEWYRTGRRLYQDSLQPIGSRSSVRNGAATPILLEVAPPKPHVMAADPFTAVAYQQRTSYPCSELSFSAIAEGSLPSISIDVEEDSASDFHFLEGDHENTTDANISEPRCMIEMVICSFALHLVENPSDLFSLLWQLSLKARWLVVLTPHKKPEIKDGWGWQKWDTDRWNTCKMSDPCGEFLHERVRCRVYRSVNT